MTKSWIIKPEAQNNADDSNWPQVQVFLWPDKNKSNVSKEGNKRLGIV